MGVTSLSAQRWRRILIAVILGVVVLCLIGVLLVAALRHRLSATVAPVDGTLHVAGLHGPVTVQRDAQGVPHIQATDLHDLLMAQGWVAASDRLWQMDMARRLPAGEAAEVLGSAVVRHDRLERLLGMRDVADRMVRTMPADQLAQLNAYASGVNGFIQSGESGGKLPAEFMLLAYKPRPWAPKDSVLIAISMAQMLDERWPEKLKREQVMARLAAHGQAALAGDLYPVGSWRDHPPVPTQPGISDPQVVPQIPLDPSQVGRNTPLVPARDELAMAANADEVDCQGCRRGSNEWAVSGAHTASGKPLLSSDMHLEHQIPDLWYEAELRAPGFAAAGVTVPGLPFVVAGHNDHIAWGFTALGGDTQDLYVEQVNSRNQYRSLASDGSGTWQPLIEEHEVIKVRGGADVQLDVERTAHGPILTPSLPGEHRAIAIDWSIYAPQVHGLPLYALDSAQDWTSFRAALATWWAPTLNVVYADDAGHIGYQAVGLIPIRAGGLASMPITPAVIQAPQATPDAASEAGVIGSATPSAPSATQAPAVPASPQVRGEWTGFVPFDALPSVLDPEGGIVATANARISPDNYPYPLTLDWAAPYRNERIWKWLGGKQGLTRADMLRLETDVYSESDQEIAQRLAYAVDRMPNASKRTRNAANILRAWNGLVDMNSPGAEIVTSVEDAFWPAVLKPKLGDGWRLYDWGESAFAREQMITGQPAGWLPPQYRSWDEFLAALVEQTLKNGPTDLNTWRYGATHTIEIEHPLWSHVPTIHAGVGPLPQSGDPSTVKQVTGNLGPSQRFTADFSDLDASTENIVAGESGDPMSPYYSNQWPFWYSGTTFALPYTPAAVNAATRHTLHLVP